MNTSFLEFTGANETLITGKDIFDASVVPWANQEAFFVKNLRSSFNVVLKTKLPHKMPTHCYNIGSQNSPDFAVQYVEIENIPIIGENGDVAIIIHTIKNITEKFLQHKNYQQVNLQDLAGRVEIENSKEESLKIMGLSPDVIGAPDQGGEVIIHRSVEKPEVQKIIAYERQRFAELLMQAPAFICMLKGPDHIFKMANSRCVQLTGKSNFKGRTVKDVFPELNSQGFVELLDNVFNSGNPFIATEMLVKVDKEGTGTLSELYIDLSCQAYKNDHDEIEGIFVFGVDVTSHVETKRKLLISNEQAELAVTEALDEKNTILESIDDAFFAVDKNWIVTYWNKHAEKVLGKARNEMLHNNLWEIYADSIDSESYRKYHQALETKQVIHFEDYYPPLTKWYEITAYPSDNGLSVYFKDITERKAAEIRLMEMNQNLEKQAKELALSNSDLEQFAYVASHDLQEPLRTVSSFLTLLANNYTNIIDDSGKKYIDFAVEGATRMHQIILDLLEFSKVGRTGDDLENIDLNELVSEIQILLRKQVEEKSATIKVDKLPNIINYKAPIRQVFQNLIGNALKYTNEHVPPLVHLSVKELEDRWEFAVKDNGIGISENHFDKIFVIFQRLHSRNEFAGTGLGLAVTKKIIERLGGKITVASEKGKGSTFYFTLLKQPVA